MLHSTESTNFSKTYYFFIDKTDSRAEWNGFVGRIWPVGRSLDTPAQKRHAYWPREVINCEHLPEYYGVAKG